MHLGDVEFDCSQYVGQRKTPLTLHLKGSKHSAKLHVEISIQEGGQHVDDESSGDENALESPDKGHVGAPTGDFSLEAFSQKQEFDKQKVSLYVLKYLQAQIADLEEAYHNLESEKHQLENLMEEWKEMLKAKDEEIQHLRDSASTMVGTDSQDSSKVPSKEGGSEDFSNEVIKKLEDEIKEKVEEIEKMKKELEQMSALKKDLEEKQDSLRDMEENLQKKYDKIADLEKQLIDQQTESKNKEELLNNEISTLKAQQALAQNA